jgi:hypothetical protein
MKLGFKLTGLHLIMILLGSLILFSVFRPIMEGFHDTDTKHKDTKHKENDQTSPESQMHTILGGLTDKAETLMYGHPYNSNKTNSTPLGAAASTLDAGASTLDAGASTFGASTFGAETNNFLHSISEKTGKLFDNVNNEASYIGQAGDTVIVDNPRQPMQLPQPQQQQSMGIPKSQIPSGSEDMYILKSQVVPPVCPACPNVSACPRPAPYPPCPPCARCPEPSFDCKKVPNYRNGSENTYLPRPVLANFSQFGM